MSDDFEIEFASDDQIECRFEKIKKVVSCVDDEIDMDSAFVSDLSSLYDFTMLSPEEIKFYLDEYFHHDFETTWFSRPLWMMVDYIDAKVGWPDQKH